MDIGMQYGGVLGLIVLIADIYAIVKTIQSGVSTGTKVLWVVVILVLPIIGFLLWLLMGPRR